MTPDATHAALRLAAVRLAAIRASYDYLSNGASQITLKIYSITDALLCTMIIPSLTLDEENYRIIIGLSSGTCVSTGVAGYAVLSGANGGSDLLSVGESSTEIVLAYDDLFVGLLVELSDDPIKRRLQG